MSSAATVIWPLRSQNTLNAAVADGRRCQSCPVDNLVHSVGNQWSFAVDINWIRCGFLGDGRPFGDAGLAFPHPPAVDKTAFAVGDHVALGDEPRHRASGTVPTGGRAAASVRSRIGPTRRVSMRHRSRRIAMTVAPMHRRTARSSGPRPVRRRGRVPCPVRRPRRSGLARRPRRSGQARRPRGSGLARRFLARRRLAGRPRVTPWGTADGR